jgi:4-hydroxy-2-oxoheptanedioate aldolase
MRAVRVGTADIVARPAKGEFMRMGRLLEAGAQAIMYPRCDSAEEAAEVVRWAKFAPLGQRGFDGANPDADYGGTRVTDYLAHANRETLIIMQVENHRAVDQAEAIAAVPGVDALWLGHFDLTNFLGIPAQFDHPKYVDAIDKLTAAARKHGKVLACMTADDNWSRQYWDKGFRLFCVGVDAMLLQGAIRQGMKTLQELAQRK